MKVTIQNDRYIADAIRSVVGDPTADVAYSGNSQDELEIQIPSGVDVNLVEAEMTNAKTNYDIAELREERDRLISKTDWWVLPDRTPTDAQKNYRQALRDITNTYTSLEDVVWPTLPS